VVVYVHPRLSKPVTISGKLADDAKQYQIRAVNSAIAELKKRRHSDLEIHERHPNTALRRSIYKLGDI